MIERIICVLIGYVCGLFQTGYILGRLKGIDIREHGSGNAGTTNTLRTMGAKYGALVLVGDALKCAIAVLIAKLIFGASHADILPILMIYAASGTILGHNFPFYMNFKGGKGMAATAGFVIFALGWKMTVIELIIFFGIFFLTHYVSLASITVYITLVISAVVYWKMDLFGFGQIGEPLCYIEYFIIMLFLAIMAIVRHKENVKRLISGTERKTYLKSKPILDVDKKQN